MSIIERLAYRVVIVALLVVIIRLLMRPTKTTKPAGAKGSQQHAEDYMKTKQKYWESLS